MRDTLSNPFVVLLLITNSPLSLLVAPEMKEESACESNNTLAKATGWPALSVILPVMVCAQTVDEDRPSAVNKQKKYVLNINFELSSYRNVGQSPYD